MLKLGCNYNGVFTQVLQRLRFLYSYSSSASSLSKVDNSSCMVNYLVNSLGFSNQQSLLYYNKVTKSVASNNANDFIKNADSVIHFFKQHDFELSHIRQMVCIYPPVLSANVDKTLKPKFQILQELGFSEFDLVHTVAATPELLRIRLVPLIQVASAVVGSDENVVIFLKRLRRTYLYCITRYLIPNVKLLEDYDIPMERIRKHVLLQPKIFVQSTESFLKLMNRVEQELGLPCDSKMFLKGIFILYVLSKKRVERKIEVFKSFGWTQSDVMALVRKNPISLLLSESNIKNKLNFFMNELGYEPAYLLSHFLLLLFSLEKRMLPRYKILLVLKEKDLIRMDYPLYRTMCMSESKFVKIIVSPYKEVHEVYTELSGHMLKIPSQGTTCADAIKF